MPKPTGLWPFLAIGLVTSSSPKHKVAKIWPKKFATFDQLRNEQVEVETVKKEFYIDLEEVSFKNFLKFTEFTGYKTTSEKLGWSFVIEKFASPLALQTSKEKVAQAGHWLKVEGADFKHPLGPVDYEKLDEVKTFTPKPDDPVTHVSWADANAYCAFAIGGRLPTEDEWELAARGGKSTRLYPWGDKFLPEKLNIWNGPTWMELPENDGYQTTAPVDSFGSQNKFGLYHIIGNVWEMTSTYYVEDRFFDGYEKAKTYSPESDQTKDMVKKGGSFMCHEKTCDMYKLHKRSQNSADSSAMNLGFRCVADQIHENMLGLAKDEL